MVRSSLEQEEPIELSAWSDRYKNLIFIKKSFLSCTDGGMKIRTGQGETLQQVLGRMFDP